MKSMPKQAPRYGKEAPQAPGEPGPAFSRYSRTPVPDSGQRNGKPAPARGGRPMKKGTGYGRVGA